MKSGKSADSRIPFDGILVACWRTVQTLSLDLGEKVAFNILGLINLFMGLQIWMMKISMATKTIYIIHEFWEGPNARAFQNPHFALLPYQGTNGKTIDRN